jgi:hypothetical protein
MPNNSSPISELLDELIASHNVMGLDRKWHARQIAARQAIESAFSKLETQNEELRRRSSLPSLVQEKELERLRPSSLTPEEAAAILDQPVAFMGPKLSPEIIRKLRFLASPETLEK